MPTRYLKPGIRDSENIDAVSPLAETLFYRLLVTVDDFGRADARPSMVKAACFPIKDAVSASDCDAMLAELAGAGLVQLYMVDGKPYMQMSKWDNVPRAKESKFPAPEHGCAQVHTSACKPRTLLPVTVTETGTQTENRKPETVTEISEAKASGASATKNLTPDEIIFGYGVPMLTTAGTAEKQARSFLGGLRKSHGDEAVVNALRECIRAKPLQPLEWLAGALKPKVAGKQSAVESRNAAAAARWLKDQENAAE